MRVRLVEQRRQKGEPHLSRVGGVCVSFFNQREFFCERSLFFKQVILKILMMLFNLEKK